MVSCCVPMCTSSRKREKITFHEFPCDFKRFAIWLKNISRCNEDGSDWMPHEHSLVCEKHFLPSDYKQNLKIKVLQPKAAPTVFPYDPECLKPEQIQYYVAKLNTSSNVVESEDSHNLNGFTSINETTNCMESDSKPKSKSSEKVRKSSPKGKRRYKSDTAKLYETTNYKESDTEINSSEKTKHKRMYKNDAVKSYETTNCIKSNSVTEIKSSKKIEYSSPKKTKYKRIYKSDAVKLHETVNCMESVSETNSSEKTKHKRMYISDAAKSYETTNCVNLNSVTEIMSSKKIENSSPEKTTCKRRYKSDTGKVCFKNKFKQLKKRYVALSKIHKNLLIQHEVFNVKRILHDPDENLKISFLADQLKSLNSSEPQWSEAVMQLCAVWQIKSPNGYRFVRNLEILTLPSERAIKEHLGFEAP